MADSGSAVRFVPLGGLGEIGMNCLGVEQSDSVLVVDCGITFPNDDHGIDVYHPDFTWLFQRANRIAGVFLTHGHEDHIGGLPYLLERVDAPVFGPPHALGLAERRLEEHEIDGVRLVEAHPGEVYEVGPFDVEPIRVAHSIIEASALRIETAAGRVVHSGDFKFDPAPPDGEPTDEDRLRRLGDEGVALLLSDSTNIDTPTDSGSERGVGETLGRLVQSASGLVLIAMFASNVQRLILLGDIAQRSGRKLCLLGRSLKTHHEISSTIGRLDWPSDLLVAPEQARTWPRDELIVLAGGTQGEPRSSFRRVAFGTHPAIDLEPGDTVIMSSRVIPGNEREVLDIINQLYRREVHLHTRGTDPGVHVSGHAGRPEQTRMIELVRPGSFIPVHGTLHHMRRHAELARSLGVEDTLVVENGAVVRFDGRLSVDGSAPQGKIAVAYGGEDLDDETLGWRRDLGRYGVALVSVAIKKRKLASPPMVSTRGVPRVDGDPRALRSLERAATEAVDHWRKKRSREDLELAITRSVRKRLESLSGTRPTVDVQVLEV